MIRLVHAHRLERLRDALVENLSGRDALEPVDIVVPHPTHASWLKIAIALGAGIAANLRFNTLHGFLRRIAEPRTKIAGAEIFESLIISILLDPAKLDSPELQAVKSYVDAAGDDPDLRDSRRVQLARQIARLFEEYLFTRKDIAKALESGSLSMFDAEDRPSVRSIAAWERTIWNMIFRPGGALGTEHRSLVDALETTPLASLVIPPVMHIFGASRLLPAHHEILARISKNATVHLYALNPCREFWGDANLEGENSALRLWGRAGREGLRVANELADYDFEARFELSPHAQSLLARFRDDVLAARQSSPDPSNTYPNDHSIRFLACPGVRREIEVIAGEIWRLVRERDLRFNEIAVVLAGRDDETYRAHLAAVFAESFDLPHHLLEVPLRSTSRILEAIELLFALPFSRFLRQDLLRLLIHPAISGHVKDTPPDEWVRWIDALMIVHGADHRDHQDTYIEKDLYNWDQGLFRMTLGAFMSGERSGDLRLFPSKGHEYLPFECALDRLPSVAEVVALVRSLIADARELLRRTMPLADWAELLSLLVTTYVKASSDQDERDLFRCVAAIRDLEALDIDRAPVSFRIASERTKSLLAGLRSSRGQPLAEGVVVGPLAALAALPFKVVFIAGLGEGQFPIAEKRTPLDLRSAARRGSDVSAREAEEYAFLERVLATEERVSISYVSRDERTGDHLEPSPVVLELIEILEREYLGVTIERAGLLEKHPFRRWDDLYFGTAEQSGTTHLRAAGKERAALDLRRDLISHLDARDAVPEGGAIDLALLAGAIPKERLEALSGSLGLTSVVDPPPRAVRGIETIEVPYGALRAFLEDPREGWKKFVLKLREEDGEEDPLAREDETFSATALEATILLREVLFEGLAKDLSGEAKEPLDAIYDRRAHVLELKGSLPTGVFKKAERKKHLGILDSWCTHVRAMFGENPRFLDALRFGKAREHTRVDAFVDPLVLEVDLRGDRRVRVELYGRTEPLIDGLCSLLALAREEAPATAVEKQALRGFLDGAVLSALGRLGEDSHRALILFASEKRFIRTFRRFSEREARDYLSMLLSDLLSGTHGYSLPCEEVFSAQSSGLAVALQAIVERRFGPYFERRQGTET